MDMWVLVPVKDLLSSKTRLASALPAPARQALVSALLADLLDTLSRCQHVAGVSVVTRCPEATALAAQKGISVLHLEQDNGLNEAVTAAVEQLTRLGKTAALVMHADLPFTQPTDIDALITSHQASCAAVTLVPDNRRDGTNALALNLPGTLPFRYGKQSFTAHQEAAAGLGLAVHVLENTRIGHDLDICEDLKLLEPGLLTPGCVSDWVMRHQHLLSWPLAANL
jgi:2-phospho-L-lactate guanylyltransferase